MRLEHRFLKKGPANIPAIGKIALETGSRRLHTPPRFVPFCRLRCSPRRKRDFAGFSGALPVLVLRAIAQRPCEARFSRYWRYRLVSRTGPVRTSPAKRARLAVTWRRAAARDSR